MKLKKSLITALVLFIIGIASWEFYWRSKNHKPNLNDEKALWAMERAKVNARKDNQVIILGSSRIYFDIQLDIWKKITNTDPIQLASTGSSPLPTFHDLVENTDFKGTIIVGVTPGLFFSTTYPMAFPWKRAQSKVDYFKKRTYAQRINYLLSVPLQQNLVLMSADDEEWADDIDLKSLLRNVNHNERSGNPIAPPFYNFGNVSFKRNMSMINRAASDTAFANTIKKVWMFFGKNAPPPDKESTMAFFLKDAKKFINRGGNLILLRCPSNGFYRVAETKFTPRNKFWNELVLKSKAKGYHFSDYPQLSNFECPEWSHLNLNDANIFTKNIAQIMLNDNALTNQ
ncbi:MAG: hypothetical protein ACWA42_05235 [Lutibacter sp.]